MDINVKFIILLTQYVYTYSVIRLDDSSSNQVRGLMMKKAKSWFMVLFWLINDQDSLQHD